MVGLGLTAPMAAQMLAAAGVAQAQPKMAYKPTKRGGGGALKTLWWQGATLLNPHFATGTKDQDGSRIFYEPLASWDPDGNLSPFLAAEIPTAQNGGIAKDGKSVTWKPQEGRGLARWQAVHRGRLRLQLGVRRRPRDCFGQHRHVQGRQGREGR
jgi:peptide/nickel transport system substrate-binding protein